jgi:hypothetical protein
MRKMKLSTIAEIRIPILLAMAVGETVGLFLCYGHRSFGPFLILSLWAIFLAISLLWIDWIRRRGVPYYNVFSTIMFGFFALGSWVTGEHIFALLFAGMSLLGLISIPRKLFRSVNTEQGGRA